MPDPLLDDLDAEQRAAVTATDAPLAIIAPAGSGKTRVLTRRIAYRVREGTADAAHVLALTFTRKAAGELVDRLQRLGVDASVTAGTFHAVALAQLRRLAAERGREPPRVVDSKTRLVGPLLGRGRAAPASVSDVVAEIEWAQARLVRPDEYTAAARAAGRPAPRGATDVADVYARYESEKRKRRVLDFDDVLRHCAEAIARDPEFAAAQRFRFRHLFVDEFQDATPLQLRVLEQWLGDRHDLAVVGDPAQAIYGFAGADASPLCDFGFVFGGGKTIALARNYRSSDAIVGLAETALGDASHRARLTPTAVRGMGPPPTISGYDDTDTEAAAVAAGCRRAFRMGVQWHEIGVLFRTNAQAKAFEVALDRRGIPFRVRDRARFDAHPAWPALLDRLRAAERDAPTRSFADHVADLAADDELANDDAVRPDRDALLEAGRAFVAAERGDGGVNAFSAWIDSGDRRDGPRTDAVDLASFHRAKGLEWSVVFVTGLEQGLVPISWAAQPDTVAEERRLLHVALSRAADELHCSWARTRVMGGRRVARDPSPWLGDLEHAARSRAQPEIDLTDRVSEMRDTLAGAHAPAPRSRRRIR